MSQRPIIGIPVQTRATASPPAWDLNQQYVRVLTSCGALPWLVPLLAPDESTIRQIYDKLDGVFLMGGADVGPTEYGEACLPCCQETDSARDWTEVRLTRWAVADGKPLFGICRGIQLINAALGGTLYQDLAEQRPESIRHDYFSCGGAFPRDFLSHSVRIEPTSRLCTILDSAEMAVNSMHHQGIRDLAPNLTPTAFAPDGLIEGFEGSGAAFLLGVQWHPEELADTSPPMKRLFQAFVDAARS